MRLSSLQEVYVYHRSSSLSIDCKNCKKEECEKPVVEESKPNVIFLLGGPGSGIRYGPLWGDLSILGKGTQSKFLEARYHWIPISAGDCLREEQATYSLSFFWIQMLNSDSKDAELIKDYIKNGLIVPGHITINLLWKKIQVFCCWNSEDPCSRNMLLKARRTLLLMVSLVLWRTWMVGMRSLVIRSTYATDCCPFVISTSFSSSCCWSALRRSWLSVLWTVARPAVALMTTQRPFWRDSRLTMRPASLWLSYLTKREWSSSMLFSSWFDSSSSINADQTIEAVSNDIATIFDEIQC